MNELREEVSQWIYEISVFWESVWNTINQIGIFIIRLFLIMILMISSPLWIAPYFLYWNIKGKTSERQS